MNSDFRGDFIVLVNILEEFYCLSEFPIVAHLVGFLLIGLTILLAVCGLEKGGD